MDATRLLEDLLSIYSPSRREAEAVAFLVDTMQRLGFEAYRDAAGNAVGVLGTGPKTCVLLGHVDTVPGFIPVRREGDRLYGRGAVDAKGPLAAFVVAARACAACPGRQARERNERMGARPGQRIVVIGAVEEEATTSKGARYALTQWQPDWCIVGEPSGWDRVTLGYKGRLLVHYKLERPVAHTAGPQPSACEEAVLFWQRLVEHAAAFNVGKPGTFEQLTPSLRQVNSHNDGFVERVNLTVALRLPPGVRVEELRSAVLALAGDGEVAFTGEEQPFRAEKNTDLVRAFLSAIRAEGGQPAFSLKTGTSDMNVVGPAWGCPIVAYGPGDSALDHTPHEHIDVNEYLRAIAVLQRVLETFNAQPR